MPQISKYEVLSALWNAKNALDKAVRLMDIWLEKDAKDKAPEQKPKK